MSKKSSEVWKHFDLIDNKTECKICKIKLAYSGGTSTMKNHLKKHKGVSLESGLKQTSIALHLFNASKKKMSSERYNNITRSLALCCATDLRPLSLVAGKGFRYLLHQLNPDYHPPSATTVTKYLSLVYDDTKAELLLEMKGCPVSLTTDLWSSISKRSYMTLTGHFISTDWELQCTILATRPLDEKHTGVNIAAALRSFTEEFCIAQVPCIVTDNAANMRVAVEEESEWERIPCFAHTLQLAIEDALKYPPVHKAIAFGRRVVTHFNHSTGSYQALREKQTTMMGVKFPVNLVQDVATRWNSQHDMMSRLLRLRVPVYSVLIDDKFTTEADRKTLDMSDKTWKVMEDAVPTLSPLASATELLTKEDKPTASQIYPLLYRLVMDLGENAERSTEMKGLTQRLKKNLIDRFELNNDGTPDEDAIVSLPMIATALDPRYKSLKFLSENQRSVLFYQQNDRAYVATRVPASCFF